MSVLITSVTSPSITQPAYQAPTYPLQYYVQYHYLHTCAPHTPHTRDYPCHPCPTPTTLMMVHCCAANSAVTFSRTPLRTHHTRHLFQPHTGRFPGNLTAHWRSRRLALLNAALLLLPTPVNTHSLSACLSARLCVARAPPAASRYMAAPAAALTRIVPPPLYGA